MTIFYMNSSLTIKSIFRRFISIISKLKLAIAVVNIAGTFTASIKKILELRRCSSWINPVSGALLLGFGIFSLLSDLPAI